MLLKRFWIIPNMQINNPLQMNDWGIKKFLKVILAIQLATWGVIGLDVIGLQIPIIRQLIGFIYLAFVPGILVLRILKLHELGNIQTLLYTVGLSIATLMFTGLFMNTVYPILGIPGPISTIPLIITISGVVLILCILSYVKDRDYSYPSFIDVGDIVSPPALFLCLLPFLAIFGTYLMNFHQNNILLIFFIVIIALIVLLIGFDKFIHMKLYPLAVFIIAISLLYHKSLISMYLWGWDIQLEYYFSNLVMNNSYWDSTLYSAINAMLAITILAPIYSSICDIGLTWVFKIIYPFLFSLTPLGLYCIFRKQTNNKIAFLSCFFFMAFTVFYGEMLGLARQQIAELFLTLLILVMISEDVNKAHRALLSIIFGASLVVSHYGTSYLYMLLLIGVWLILFLPNQPAIQKLTHKLHFKLRGYGSTIPSFRLSRDRAISSTFVILFLTFALSWYMYIASSHAFNVIVNVGNHIISNIYTDFLSPEASQALNIVVSGTVSPLHEATKILHHITQIFIIVGVIGSVFMQNYRNRFNKEYLAFSLLFFTGYFAILAFPYSGFGTTRLYHLSLIFLAPFCVIGGITVFKVVSKIVKVSWTDQRVRSSLRALSIFFAIFLLFNSGWVYEVAKDHPSSIALNNTIDYPRFNDREVSGAKWLHRARGDVPIYADAYRWLLLIDSEGYPYQWFTSFDKVQNKRDSYIYLGSFNVIESKVLTVQRKGVRGIREYIDMTDLIKGRNRIYDNRGAQVYQ